MGKNYWNRHKLHSNLTSQVALEYLATYGWAFISISVTIGALYYFGVLDFSKYLPQKCIFPSQLKCLDFNLNPNMVNIKLINNLGEDIRVTSMQITNDANPPVSCTPPAVPFDWVHTVEKDLSFTSCSGGAYLPDSRVELRISVIYYAINTPSNPIHLISGKINGRVLSG